MIIKEISETSTQLHSKIILLLEQLTDKKVNFSMDYFSSIVQSENSILYGAFEKDELIGILALVIVNIPTGKQLRIEDVVIDKTHRGKGVGELLMLEAVNKAKKLKISKISLTSNPSRISANKLYQKLGFKLRNTNAYVHELSKTNK